MLKAKEIEGKNYTWYIFLFSSSRVLQAFFFFLVILVEISSLIWPNSNSIPHPPSPFGLTQRAFRVLQAVSTYD